MSRNMSRLLGAVCMAGLALASSPVFAFDRAGYAARVEATLKEAQSGSIADPKATLARLDELTAIGMTAAKEFGAKSPKWAKLMDQLVADAPSFNKKTGVEINDKWGEEGTVGDAIGIPFKDISQFGEERAYMELVVSPNVSYELVKKWEKTKKASELKELVDENNELTDHLKVIK
jgi:hypothetical protein